MGANVRVEQLQPQLRSAGIDVAVIRMTENVLFVSGHFVQIAGAGFAVVPAEGEATLLVPEYEAPEAAEVWDGALETFPVSARIPPAMKAASSKAATLSRIRYQPRNAPSGIMAHPNTSGITRHPIGVSPKITIPSAIMNLPKGGWRSNW